MAFISSLLTHLLTIGLFWSINHLCFMGLDWLTIGITDYVGDFADLIPSLTLAVSCFAAGVVVRQAMNQFRVQGQQLILFILAALAHGLFLWNISQELQVEVGTLTAFRPLPLDPVIEPWLIAMPMIYLLGLVFSSFFSLERS